MSAPLIRIFAGGAKELTDEIMWSKVTKALYKCSRYGQKIGVGEEMTSVPLAVKALRLAQKV